MTLVVLVFFGVSQLSADRNPLENIVCSQGPRAEAEVQAASSQQGWSQQGWASGSLSFSKCSLLLMGLKRCCQVVLGLEQKNDIFFFPWSVCLIDFLFPAVCRCLSVGPVSCVPFLSHWLLWKGLLSECNFHAFDLNFL